MLPGATERDQGFRPTSLAYPLPDFEFLRPPRNNVPAIEKAFRPSVRCRRLLGIRCADRLPRGFLADSRPSATESI